MSAVEPGRALRLKAGVEWQRVDDEIVVLDLNSSSYLAINDSGGALWPLIADGTTEPRLIDALTTRFGLDPARAQADVGAFVDRLRSLTLVEVDEA